MGYNIGQGLGKVRQDRVNIVEAIKRRGLCSLGLHMFVSLVIYWELVTEGRYHILLIKRTVRVEFGKIFWRRGAGNLSIYHTFQ